MVGHTMRKALRKLEARKSKDRKDRAESSRLAIIDPSYELSQQRNKSADSKSNSTYIHSIGLQSNPELHTTAHATLSSNASVYSFDTGSISSLSTSHYNLDDDLNEDPDMLPFDVQMRTFPTRRRSTGSSRAKSQEKLARILGWNTSFPQWKPSASHLSSESLKSPAGSSRRQNPIWEDDTAETPDSMPDLKMRQYPTRRANSMREYSTTPSSSSDFQLRQFLSVKPYKDNEKIRQRSKLDEEIPARAESPRSTSSSRRNSNPNVHKPLPNTPAFPTFPTIPPLQDNPTMTSTSTPISATQDEFLPNFELSAEEASILLSQPEPMELSSEPSSQRAELSDPSTLLDPTIGSSIRSKSPTNARTGSSGSQYPDFGPGTTLSIIEEEPFDADDLAKFKVYELPAFSIVPLEETLNSNPTGDICPGLSPSSSLSSRRMKFQEDETEARLESQADSELGENIPDDILHSDDASIDSDTEGEEIIVVFDRSSGDHGLNMNGKSFLALDEEDDDEDDGDKTDTEETYRNSIQSGESRFTSQPIHNPMSDNLEVENHHDEGYRRSTGADTTKTVYTNRTTSTLVGHDQDFSTDLAKMMDWI